MLALLATVGLGLFAWLCYGGIPSLRQLAAMRSFKRFQPAVEWRAGKVVLLSFNCRWAEKVTDDDLPPIGALVDLYYLYLRSSKVTDRGLIHVEGLTNLKVLVLSDTDVSDAAVVHLSKLRNLTALYLKGTKFTGEGVRRLQQALPETKIYCSFSIAPGDDGR